MKRRILFPAALVAALLAACASDGGAGSDDRSGTITGTVLLGPTCAVETVASPCPDVPLPGVEVRLAQGDRVIETVVSDKRGRFSFEVSPGSYVLRAVAEERDAPVAFAKPVPVVVTANESVRADVLVDSGIR